MRPIRALCQFIGFLLLVFLLLLIVQFQALTLNYSFVALVRTVTVPPAGSSVIAPVTGDLPVADSTAELDYELVLDCQAGTVLLRLEMNRTHALAEHLSNLVDLDDFNVRRAWFGRLAGVVLIDGEPPYEYGWPVLELTGEQRLAWSMDAAVDLPVSEFEFHFWMPGFPEVRTSRITLKSAPYSLFKSSPLPESTDQKTIRFLNVLDDSGQRILAGLRRNDAARMNETDLVVTDQLPKKHEGASGVIHFFANLQSRFAFSLGPVGRLIPFLIVFWVVVRRGLRSVGTAGAIRRANEASPACRCLAALLTVYLFTMVLILTDVVWATKPAVSIAQYWIGIVRLGNFWIGPYWCDELLAGLLLPLLILGGRFTFLEISKQRGINRLHGVSVVAVAFVTSLMILWMLSIGADSFQIYLMQETRRLVECAVALTLSTILLTSAVSLLFRVLSPGLTRLRCLAMSLLFLAICFGYGWISSQPLPPWGNAVSGVLSCTLCAFLLAGIAILVWRQLGLPVKRRGWIWLTIVVLVIPYTSVGSIYQEGYVSLGFPVARVLPLILDIIVMCGPLLLVWHLSHDHTSPRKWNLQVTLGATACSIAVFGVFGGWLFASIAVLLGWLVFEKITTPESAQIRDSIDEARAMDDLLIASELASALRQRRRVLQDKVIAGTLSADEFQAFSHDIAAQTREVGSQQHLAAARRTVFGRNSSESTLAQGFRSAKYSLILATPWIVMSLAQTLETGSDVHSFPLLALTLEAAAIAIRWLGIGFFFGYFYSFLLGNTGAERGFIFGLALCIATLPQVLSGPLLEGEFGGMLFPMVQYLVHSVLLGALAFDYATIRRNAYSARALFRAYGMTSLGISLSSLITVAAASVTTLVMDEFREWAVDGIQIVLPEVQSPQEAPSPTEAQFDSESSDSREE